VHFALESHLLILRTLRAFYLQPTSATAEMFYRAQTARKAEIERYQTFINISIGVIQTSRLNSKID